MADGQLLGYQPVGHLWAEDLAANPIVVQYLTGPERGLTMETIQAAGLGYVGRSLPGWERFQGAISIPYHDGLGREVGMRFRWSAGDRKYDQRKGTPHRLYGYHLVEEPVIYLTEGEFDALILRQMGLAAIGVPGATAWQPHWRWLFRDASEVFVAFDNDPSAENPGRKGAFDVARSLRDIVKATVIDLPPGRDISDLYTQDGPEAVRKALT